MSSRWTVVVSLVSVALIVGGCSGGKHEAPATVVVTAVETGTPSPSAGPRITATPAESATAEPGVPAAGPVLGDPCIGADTGKTAVDPGGTAIVCDDYRWREDTGQTPGHSWADDQAEWMECLETHTRDECRALLHP